MNIRQVKKEDITQIKTMVQKLSHFYLADDVAELPSWLAATLETQAFAMRLNDTAFMHWVCVHESQVIGYIAMKNKNHLYHLFVAQEHQGQGIAKQLWATAMEACVSPTYTLRSSLFAVPVYESFGFVKTGSVDVKEGVQFQAMDWMGK